jgi:hypothetical protein
MKCMIVGAAGRAARNTVVPGSSVLDLNVDVGKKVFAFYVAYIV